MPNLSSPQRKYEKSNKIDEKVEVMTGGYEYKDGVVF